MVDLSDRVKEIKKLVDDGKYFAINRARQYGKTTTISRLCEYLQNDYYVLSLDFQKISNASFKSEEAFVKAFSRSILDRGKKIPIPDTVISKLEDFIQRKEEKAVFDELFSALSDWCRMAEKPVVMIIDEVDTATNNQVFLDFLAQLRAEYLEREEDPEEKTFRSVILAGVTDVKHLKMKIRPEDQHKVNSPWNIAADFDIDMSLAEAGIKGMLDEYETDHKTGMDTAAIAGMIRKYTNGYPYLVSRICQIIDTKLVPGIFKTLHDAWTEYGIDEAVKMLLSETENSLFESLTGKLVNYPELKQKLRNILLRGEVLAWLPYDEAQQQLYMYGFIRNDHNTVAVSNMIFEKLLYTHFIGESDKNNDLKQKASEIKSSFVDKKGILNVPKIMEHFIKEHNRIHRDNSEKFLEEEGRERFITYVSAVINGTGTYDIEPQTRDHKRMDLVIHYLGRRYIIELKIWHGDRYNAKGEKQICDYLDHYGLTTGYLLSFNFNKKKESGVKQVQIGDKVVYEGIV
ncbi:MAG: AAA-like domain-containing protein [Lachnospiraceae bacterium]|nr:AAA-like domain-containing protein [Lachnospiraceae bacterium]